MKNFIKMVFAVFFGLAFFFVVLFFSLLGIGSALMSEPEVELKEQTVFHLHLKGVLQERSSETIYDYTNELMNPDLSHVGLDELLAAIDKAANKEQVKGIYLECGLFSASPASVREIRNALLRFKKSGKFLVAYADTYTQGVYQIASVADRIFLNPQGMLGLKGLAMQNVFFKNLLDKLGVEMQVVKVGTFKSAVEPYVLTGMSDANREQLTVLSNSIWNTALRDIAEFRHVDISNLNEFADKGMMFSETERTVEYGLVDSLLYEAEMKLVLESLAGKDYKICTFKEMKNAPKPKIDFYNEKIAVVYAAGAIDGGNEGEERINSEKLTETLLDLAEDTSVKSVVLRVNSPGGSAYGSEQIWNAVRKVKENKPVIVSMGDYAASGGYYISCVADTIIAQPNTLTGSIGIFGLIPNVDGLMKKVGLSFDMVKTNKMSDLGVQNRAMTREERDLMQGYVNRGYELFVKRCADGRGKKVEEIKAIAEGRVWSGEDALRLGLVDMLGGLDDAVAVAAQKAGLNNKYRIVGYPEKKDLFSQLMEDFSASVETRILTKKLGEQAAYYRYLNELTHGDAIQARMPYMLEVK